MEDQSSSSSLRSPTSASSELNHLPPLTMTSRSSPPSLKTLTPSRQIDRMINSNHSPSPLRMIYSDRFIPSRFGSNFALFDIALPPNSSASSGANGSRSSGGCEDHSSAYAALLRTALFGPEAGGVVTGPSISEKRSYVLSPPSRNIFRYKTETRRSMHSLSPFGFDDAAPGASHSPVKAPRKVQRSPYKGILILGLLLALIQCGTGEGNRQPDRLGNHHHRAAPSCGRKHSVVLTDFGGVGDGKTSNTKAFKAAIDHLAQFSSDGGAQLVVPPGKWLTGSFNLTSHFTLFLHKDAVILGSQDESEWPLVALLPSYGKGRDAPDARRSALIYGTNLTDVVITGHNGTIDGQGAPWWARHRARVLNATRPYMIEILFSDQIQIFNLTLIDSPSWFVHPIYSSNIVIQGLTILAPIDSANTDGIDPDSCTNIRIEDCFIVSGDDCIAVKSGWDQYGNKVGMPTKHLLIRRLTCISPDSAALALGSEMSGGIEDVRAEDVTCLNTQSAIRIKTAIGRGAYVKNIFARRFVLKTMKYVFWMTGAYGSHPDPGFDPKALPIIERINYRDFVAENVTYSARLDGIKDDPFKGICISNTSITLTKIPKKLQWNCTNIEGITSNVTPKACDLLPEKTEAFDCPFPEDKLPIEDVPLKACFFK